MKGRRREGKKSGEREEFILWKGGKEANVKE